VLIIFLILSFLIYPGEAFARVTPNDIYQAKRAAFTQSLAKISNPANKQAVEQADKLLNSINQKVCLGFDVETSRLAAILEEEKSRQNINKTIVAYGQGDTPMDQAAYYLNYAVEAVAYQKVQDYTPQIGGNLKLGLNSSVNNLKSDLKTTQGKILRAKLEIKKALDYYEVKRYEK